MMTEPNLTSEEGDDVPSLVVKLVFDSENVRVANKSLMEICEALDLHEEDAINICCMIADHRNLLRLAYISLTDSVMERVQELITNECQI